MDPLLAVESAGGGSMSDASMTIGSNVLTAHKSGGGWVGE